MPFDPKKYPPDWKEIRARILDRAASKCEKCGVPNHAVGARDRHDEWHNEDDIQSLNSSLGMDLFPAGWPKIIRIILTVAHIHDPDPMNCTNTNLAAWCQRCHNQHDGPMRAKNAAATRLRKKEVGQEALPI